MRLLCLCAFGFALGLSSFSSGVPAVAHGEAAPAAGKKSDVKSRSIKRTAKTRAPQQQKKQVPPPQSPPQRPAGEPSPEGASPKRPTLAPLPPPDTSSPPPMLPQASRERMRECAEEWARMKTQTPGALPMWRNFAAKCLTR
ncbi:hypothetical protein [Methylocystis heyeri]|uniref:hypothetical protein n=1 Tax=Methylocystis heyeri TaxID=391905 RepID=UPI00138A0B88|nr:hypothetical protein [Methylocystis heyeri]